MSRFTENINPLHLKIGEITNFKDVTPEGDLEIQEYPYLQSITKELIKDTQGHLNDIARFEVDLEKYIHLIDNETGDDKLAAISFYNKVLKQITDKVSRLNRELDIVNAPYFGKIVFNRKAQGVFPARDMQIYIGKFAYIDRTTGAPLITDWRAPIANLYYKNSGPTDNVSFKSPMGQQQGDLTQKRQFQIHEARIQSIYDAKSGNVAADSFLLSQLKNRVGKKLAEIVATIQEQQNDIIREGVDRPIIIQGVAGSGKTTIILHRLAYLFFTYQDKIRGNKSLVIAPNTMFLDYISDVLPSLGISNVETNTYLFWAKKILGWNHRYILNPADTDYSSREYKGNIDFMHSIASYFKEFEEELLDALPYSRKDRVRQRFALLRAERPSMSFLEALNLSVDYAFAQRQFTGKTTGSYLGNLDNEKEKKKEIKQYVNKSTNVYRIYKGFYSKKGRVPEAIRKYTLEGLKGIKGARRYRFEDLAPMVWIHIMLHGVTDYQKEYIVVDEAQDSSPFELFTLYMTAKNNNITLAGDVAQAIKPPFFIKDWSALMEDIREMSGNDLEFSYHQLNRSYRTTVEIIEYANKVIKQFFPSSYKAPEAVLRHGDPVEVIETQTTMTQDIRHEVIDWLNEQDKKDAVTTAIICRDDKHAEIVYENLKTKEGELAMAVHNQRSEDHQSGIMVLSVLKAKGLEFDSVMIADLTADMYEGTELDSRLFYVACTRALHRLAVVTTDDKSILIK